MLNEELRNDGDWTLLLKINSMKAVTSKVVIGFELGVQVNRFYELGISLFLSMRSHMSRCKVSLT